MDWALLLQSELRALTERSARLQREFEGRTEWALSLEKDLARHVNLAVHFRDEFTERSRWALNLEAERIRLEERLRQQEAAIAELETQLECRWEWALSIQEELEAQTRRRDNLERELKLYLHNPFRLLMRILLGIGRRLGTVRDRWRLASERHPRHAGIGTMSQTMRADVKTGE